MAKCLFLSVDYICFSIMATWRAGAAGKNAVKVSTNLTRLDVAKNPGHNLGVFYSKTLRALSKMPAEFPYRRYTEQVRDLIVFSRDG